jgi:hypothetical protein
MKERHMSATKRIEETLGKAQSPSRGFGESRPFTMESGTPEARLHALEHDVAKLRGALLLAAAEIGRIDAKIDAIA